ncbi:MAG: hypothetical protein AB7G35_13855, partial [Hyphomicrobiaceae bacterium]
KSDAGGSLLSALAFPFDILDESPIRLISSTGIAEAPDEEAIPDGWVWIEELGGLIRLDDLARFRIEAPAQGQAERPVINWQRQAAFAAHE